MELYLAIALGITLGELGKELIYRIQNGLWTLKNRNNPKYQWLKDLDNDEELLAK